jgi:ElaB/YqjD/DUF883 family membrane-anchored ribosome-binding protein
MNHRSDAQIRQGGNDWIRKVESSLESYPVFGITVAVCLGVFLGWLIKRK